MNISILAVGTELLMGKTQNTNATYLSTEINKLGHSVVYHMTIGDNPKRLESSLNYLLSISDMVITTGGLGPTKDDLTKEIISKTINKKLIMNDIAHENLLERFKKFNSIMTENNIKQSYLPEDSILMNNKKGTAPGFISLYNKKYIAALPGPPKEMMHMFNCSLKDFLIEKSEATIVSEYINLFGIGESKVASIIDDIIENQTDSTVAIYAGMGQVSIRVTAMCDNEKSGKQIIKLTVDKITELLGEYIVNYGQKNILEITIDEIIKKSYNISTAESCTGGLIASNIINLSGASRYFDQGYITYTNKSKEDILNVSVNTLHDYGAVSEETCLEMLEGLYLKTKTNICIAVTGIAGPTGGTIDKPVGLVYIGVSINGNKSCKKYNFFGDRNNIRERSYLNAINDVRKKITSCN